MKRFFSNILANLMRGIVLPLTSLALSLGNGISYIMKMSLITLFYPLNIVLPNIILAFAASGLLLANILSNVGYLVFRVIPGGVFLSIYPVVSFVILETISVVFNISYKAIVLPLQFSLASIANVATQILIFVYRAVIDALVLGYLGVRNIITATSRGLYDLGVIAANVIVDLGRAVGRGLSDIGHYAKQYLYDRSLVFVQQRIYDFYVNVSRTIAAKITAFGLSVANFRFATYVAAKSLALRTSYAFGRMSNSAVYYSGNLVVKVERFGNDTYNGASAIVSTVTIPAQEKLTKAAHSAQYIVENASVNAARFADDYIAYPITYAFHNAGVAIPKAAWDGYINVWRGVQSVCTSGIRGFHDIVVDTKHVAATKASNFGSSAYDAATTAKQGVIKAGHKASSAIERLNVYEFFESGADKIVADIKAKEESAAKRGKPSGSI